MTTTTETRWQVRVGAEQTDAAYDPPLSKPQRGIYVLAHGAGGNMDTRNLLREARLLREIGFGVARFNFFYRAAHRSYPDKMPQLIACYRAVIESFTENVGALLAAPSPSKGAMESSRARQPDSLRHDAHAGAPLPLFIGGHSMGGRAATMMAAEGFACDGLILFSYPLHPPGKFEQLRAEHLPRIAVPVLCFNGTRDDFMRRDLMENLLPELKPAKTRAGWTHHWIEHADHSLNVLKKSGRSATDVDKEIADSIQQWIKEVAGFR